MSLLDFLKPKQKIAPHEAKTVAQKSECDISKTGLVAQLLQVPRPQRDDRWYQNFYQNVSTASFACGNPQTLVGPDGFTYFILRTPEANQPFISYCLQNMKDDFLLERGWGVVFNPSPDGVAEWVFTYGNIVNLHLNNQFVSVVDDAAIQNIAFDKNVGVLKEKEQVMIAQPSEAYLPRVTRTVLKSFLQYKGIARPKVMMISSNTNGKFSRKLALNIAPENYPETTKLDHLMQQVGWFLPNDYLLIPLSEKSELAKDFCDL